MGADLLSPGRGAGYRPCRAAGAPRAASPRCHLTWPPPPPASPPASVTYYVDHQAHNPLLQLQVPLHSAGTIPAGQHLFPFRISLPSSLPPSCKLSKSFCSTERAFE